MLEHSPSVQGPDSLAGTMEKEKNVVKLAARETASEHQNLIISVPSSGTSQSLIYPERLSRTTRSPGPARIHRTCLRIKRREP